jgi:hypothetical protein
MLYTNWRNPTSPMFVGNQCSPSDDPVPIESISTMRSLNLNYPYLHVPKRTLIAVGELIPAHVGNGVSVFFLIVNLNSMSNILAISFVKEQPCRVYFIEANNVLRPCNKFSIVWRAKLYEVDVCAVSGCYEKVLL